MPESFLLDAGGPLKQLGEKLLQNWILGYFVVRILGTSSVINCVRSLTLRGESVLSQFSTKCEPLRRTHLVKTFM